MSALFSAKSTLLDTALKFFQEDDWNVQQAEDRPWILMRFRGKDGSWNCLMSAREEQQQLIFYSILESKVPEERRSAAAEYLTRANYGLPMGNFELDLSDGEVRYKTSIDTEGGELTTMMVKNLVYTNVLTTDRYYPGLMSVMYGGATPEAAISEVES